MTLPAPTYDLVLLLDPQVEEPARAKIVADSLGSIESSGELLRHDEWGERALTYPIDKHASAEYHLLQFHSGGPELLDGLDRTLRITDGVLRHRIIKLKPGVPDAPEMSAAPPLPKVEAGESATQAEAPAALTEEPAPAAEASVAADPVEAPAAETPPAEAPVAETPPAEPAAAEAPAAEDAAPEAPGSDQA
ncbi:MAG TPA: 30S ribosomal protein S6 [Solirubrobacteraceae bacterium]|jgi:small subunit ribosomal protein S6|nr:30S ribosomal protein S6 [Solirubrobacteraceae bacterium]